MSNDNSNAERGAEKPTHPNEIARLAPNLLRLARVLAHRQNALEAEDMTQEALALVLARIRHGEKIENPGAYLRTVLRNQRQHAPEPFNELTQGNTPSITPAAPARMAMADVRCAISRLPPRQRELMQALLADEPSYKELARRFHLPVGTVMSRIARARQRLRKDLGLPRGSAVPALMAP